MARVSLAICLFLLTTVQLRSAWLRLRGPTGEGPPLPRREAFALATDGGLVCCPGHGRTNLSVPQRLLVGASLDPASMTARDWQALPDVGPRRADALAVAHGDVVRARLPPKIARAIAHRVGLDEEARPDICSLGSWPTTSSGCDRQR